MWCDVCGWVSSGRAKDEDDLVAAVVSVSSPSRG